MKADVTETVWRECEHFDICIMLDPDLDCENCEVYHMMIATKEAREMMGL